MPLLDLQVHLEQELSENPFLELSEADNEDDLPLDEEGRDDSEDAEDEVDWEEILLDGFDVGGSRQRYDPTEPFQPTAVESLGLHDHLEEQIRLLRLDQRQLRVADEIIGNIDDDGFLGCSVKEITRSLDGLTEEIRKIWLEQAREIEDDDAREAELKELAWLFAPYSVEEVEAVLQVVQGLDPTGVGARTLGECLRIQLKQEGREDTLAYRIASAHFDAFLNRRWTELSRILEVTLREIQKIADEIAKLDLRPGRKYAADPDPYVVPDLILERVGGEYMVFVNDTSVPRLRLSRSYREVAADRGSFTGRNKEFISQKLNAASWLIQVMEQRRQTMLSVMRFIVDRQANFFDKGVQHLKPLTLREVAEHIGTAESTVSRVTAGKYVQTPTGMFPLKYFFSSGLPTVMGRDVSSRGVRARIKNLVDDEDSRNPLTDRAIVNLLKSDGVKIARRTVAKYRDHLGIVPARMRKRF